MDSVQTLIDKASELVGSRYKLAQALHEDESFIGKVARGQKRASPALRARVAALLGLDAREAALDGLIDAENDPAKRDELRAILTERDRRKR